MDQITQHPTRPIDAVAALSARRLRGKLAYLSGSAAEDAVAQEYEARGYEILARRWRSQGGEIDLILRYRDVYVFAEVKKSHSFDAALQRLTHAQAARIHAAASEYLASTPKGQLSDVRFDLALCDGHGAVDIREGLFSHF